MSFVQWIKSVGGNEALVEQITNPSASGWYGYWKGLRVTLLLGKSSVTKEWSYYEFCDLMKNEHGSDSYNVTGQALGAERAAVEYLEAHGYFTVCSHECYPAA